MEAGSTFKIEARLDHHSEGVATFDPVQVVCRMRGAFPELIESTRDYLWETFEGLQKIGGGDAALRVAVRDMQERGPKILFEIPLPDGRTVRGTAERYWVSVHLKEDFPAEFRRRFTRFLEGLTMQPIQIRDGVDI